MAAGDTLQRITAQDQLIFNAAGQVVGIKSPHANGGDLYFDPAALTVRPAASAVPASNGDMTFELTSNTSLTVRVKGSDGTVRSAVLTLA